MKATAMGVSGLASFICVEGRGYFGERFELEDVGPAGLGLRGTAVEVFVGCGEGVAEWAEGYSGTLASFMKVLFMEEKVVFSWAGSATWIFFVPLERKMLAMHSSPKRSMGLE
jgi:hypothetical protein